MLRGTSEPILIGTSLWAVERHLAGRRGTAFALGVAASLIRPEAWPFVLVYAAWLWRGERRMRIPIALGLFAIPFFWFVPAWIGSGQPFLAASHAKDYNGHLGAHPLLEVLRRGTDIQILPMLILALVAVGLAAWRGGRLSGAAGAASGPPDGVSWRGRVLAWLPPPGGDRLTLALGACALAWWVIVVAMTLDGYPGLERFYLPAAAITCVLAGAGVVRLAALAGSRLARPGRLIPAAVVLLLVVASIPFATGRIDTARSQEPTAARAVTRLDQLSAAVAAVGGHRGVYPCRTSFAAVNHGVQTALAWKLHVTLGRVGTTMRHQGVMFVGPHDSIDGGPAAIDHRLTQIRLLAHVGAWRVYRVTSPGSSTRCVGG
jgi:hypothetical protein